MSDDPSPDGPASARFWHTSIGGLAAMALVASTTFLDAVVPPLGVPAALLVIWCLLRAAGERWRDLGLRRPSGWARTLALAGTCAALLEAAAFFVIVPVLRAAGIPLPDLSRFAGIMEGNLPMLLIFLTVSWTTAGFGEEVIWRGFMMGRAARLFGATRGAWIAALAGLPVLAHALTDTISFLALYFGWTRQLMG